MWSLAVMHLSPIANHALEYLLKKLSFVSLTWRGWGLPTVKFLLALLLTCWKNYLHQSGWRVNELIFLFRLLNGFIDCHALLLRWSTSSGCLPVEPGQWNYFPESIIPRSYASTTAQKRQNKKTLEYQVSSYLLISWIL